MPTRYVRKVGSTRGSWSEDDLVKAIGAVKKREMGINEASRYFSIPKTTLKRRLKNNNFSKGCLGPQSVLGSENEKKIAIHIQQLQSTGFSPSRDCVRSMAFKLAEQLKIKHNFDVNSQKAGYDWLLSFLNRNPNLAVRKSEGVSKNRAIGMNKAVVGNYFKLLEKAMTDNELLDKPANVFNMDETGLQLNNKPGEVIAVRGSKSVNSITSGEKGETITAVSCFSAEGTYLPPYCIFKGKNKKVEFTDGMPPGSAVVMNEKSAYINSDIFFDWLKNHFLPRKPTGKALIILDGHASHCSSVQMLEFAEANEIILLSLPSHTSHYLQPLDRSFFKSLKSNYNTVCNTFIKNNPTRQITRLQFGKLLGEAWAKSATVQNAISGFKRCGIVPLDMSAVPEYCYLTTNDQEPNNAEEPPLFTHEGDVMEKYVPKPKKDRHTIKKSCQDASGKRTLTFHTESENDISLNEGTSTRDLSNTPSSPVPGTSSELTPTKLLIEISPIPVLKKKITIRNICASMPKILNSKENIQNIIKAKEKKQINLKLKEERKRKREITTELKMFKSAPKNKKKNQDGIVYNDSSEEETDWDEDKCVGCLEDYNTTKSKDDWVKCQKCSRWSHENCTKFGNLCDVCGRIELKCNKLNSIKKL